MATLQQGVEITIRAFLPVGKSLEEQHDALTLVKEAKTSGKFDALLDKSLDLVVKTEMRNRRTTAEAPAAEPKPEDHPDYQRGFIQGHDKPEAVVGPDDANIAEFNAGWAAGNAALEAEKAAQQQPPATGKPKTTKTA